MCPGLKITSGNYTQQTFSSQMPTPYVYADYRCSVMKVHIYTLSI